MHPSISSQSESTEPNNKEIVVDLIRVHHGGIALIWLCLAKYWNGFADINALVANRLINQCFLGHVLSISASSVTSCQSALPCFCYLRKSVPVKLTLQDLLVARLYTLKARVRPNRWNLTND
ncbi:hypothetical protein INT43_007688 [Umbelopsis isabellina]|uniref:Uncharacterized protein n=1 Tax=Mortierella isabellina TaxID=91625 RepID=A0A8H7PP75_MORIS|nr:hypothetical protein INT43_007688 [Umbelopsis isabellina]